MMIAGHGWKRRANTLRMITLPLAAAIGASLMAGSAAIAQTYPTQLIKVICPIPSGSPIDVTARLVTNDLSNRLGKPVIVENRPGGGGTIGVGEFTRAAPDGHTLLCGAIGDAFAAKVVGRDPAKDFIPVARVARIAWVLVVRPGLPANSVGQLIEHAKANPGKLDWGFGQGTAPHMFGEMFKAATGSMSRIFPTRAAPRRCLTCWAVASTSTLARCRISCRSFAKGRFAPLRSRAKREARTFPMCRRWRNPDSLN